MIRERNETYFLLFAFIDFIASLLAYVGAFWLRFFIFEDDPGRIASLSLDIYILLGIAMALTQILVFYFMNMYQPTRLSRFTGEFGRILSGTLLTILLSLGMIFFVKTERISRSIIVLFGLLDLFFISFVHNMTRVIIDRVNRKGRRLRTLLVIGASQTAKRVEALVGRHALYGYKIAGFISLPEETSVMVDKEKILGGIEKLPGILSEIKPYHVIYAEDLTEQKNLLKAITACSFEGIHLFLVPGFTDLLSSKLYMETLDGLSFIGMREIAARHGFNRFIKRVFDFIFAFLFLVIFSPLFIIISILVKISSKGPVLLKQERVGLNNKTFMLLKFRTMYVQESKQSDTVWTTKKDPRVTPVGRVLRKLSLDEIPQFINVLTGKMSVVGPRPERPFWVEQFKEKYKGYMQRHGMKAGITGWAQVHGLRGDTSIEERVAADIYYIENWSFLLDLKIIFLTPFKSVVDKNAY